MRIILPLILAVALLAGACGDDVDTQTADPGTPAGGDRAGDGDGNGAADPGNEAPTVDDLAGDWVLRSLTGADGAVALPDGDLRMLIAPGEISGDLGCNSFAGGFTAAGDGTISFGALAQTEMACAEPERMAFEATYGQLLGGVTSWALDDATLTLSGDGATVVYEQFVPVHQPLAGTVWHFDSVYDGDAVTNSADMDGVELVIDGARVEMTAPGCDGWSGDVEVDGVTAGRFVLGDYRGIEPASCGIVASTMETLATATRFEIDENRLTVLDDTGPLLGFAAR